MKLKGKWFSWGSVEAQPEMEVVQVNSQGCAAGGAGGRQVTGRRWPPRRRAGGRPRPIPPGVSKVSGTPEAPGEADTRTRTLSSL